MSATVSYTFNKPSGILDLSNTVTINKASASTLTATTNPSLSGDRLVYSNNILGANYSTISLPGRTYSTNSQLTNFNERFFIDITVNSTTGWNSNPFPIYNFSLQDPPYNYGKQSMLFFNQVGIFGGYTNNSQYNFSFPTANSTRSVNGQYSVYNAQFANWFSGSYKSYTINNGDRIFIMVSISKSNLIGGTVDIYRYTPSGIDILMQGQSGLISFPDLTGTNPTLPSVNLFEAAWNQWDSARAFNGVTLNNLYYNIPNTITGLQIATALVKTAPILNNNLTLYYPPSLSTNNGRVFDLSNIFYTLSGSVRPDPTAANKNYGIVLFNFPNPSQWTFTKSSGTSSIISLTATQGIVCELSNNITNSVKRLTYNGTVSGDISFNFLVCDSGTIPTSNSIVDITTRGGNSAFSQNIGTITIPTPIPLSEEYSLFKQLYELSGYDLQFSPNGRFAALLNNTFIDIYSSSGDIWTKTQTIDISGGTTGNLYIRSIAAAGISSYIQSNISAACKFSNSANNFIIIRSNFIYVYRLVNGQYIYVNRYNMRYIDGTAQTPIQRPSPLITDATISDSGTLFSICYQSNTYNSTNYPSVINIRNCTDLSSTLVNISGEPLFLTAAPIASTKSEFDSQPGSYFYNKIDLSPDNNIMTIQCYQPFSNSNSLYAFSRQYILLYNASGNIYLDNSITQNQPYSSSQQGEISNKVAYYINNSNNRIFSASLYTAIAYLKSSNGSSINASSASLTNSSVYYITRYQATNFQNVYTTSRDNNNPYNNRGLGRSSVLSADGKVLIASYMNPAESSTINTTGSYPISILYNSKSVIDPTFPITAVDVSNNVVFVHNKSITKNDGNIFGMDVTSTADCKYVGVASTSIPVALTSSASIAGKCYLYKLEIHYAPRYTNLSYNEITFTIDDNNSTYIAGSAVHVGSLLTALGAVQDNGNTMGIVASFPTIANFKFQHANQLLINTPFWTDISGATGTNRIHLDANTYIRCIPINISSGQVAFDSSFNVQIWDTDNGITSGTIAAIPAFKSTGYYSQNSINARFRVNAPIHIIPNQNIRSSQISTFKLFKNMPPQQTGTTLHNIIIQGALQWRDTLFNKDLSKIKVRCRTIENSKGRFIYTTDGTTFLNIDAGATLDLSATIQYIPFKNVAKTSDFIDFAFLQNSTTETTNIFRIIPVIKAPPSLLSTSVQFELTTSLNNKTISASWPSIQDATYTVSINNTETQQTDNSITINGSYGSQYNIWILANGTYTTEKAISIPNTITLGTPVITNFINCTVPLQITNISGEFTSAQLNITLDNSSVYQTTILKSQIGALNSQINISGIVLDFNKQYSCYLTSQYSDISTVQIGQINCSAPLPTNITTTNITGKSMTLNWSFNNTNDISGFILIFGNNSYIIGPTIRTYNIVGLEPYLEYAYAFAVLYKNNTIIYSPNYKQLTLAQYESPVFNSGSSSAYFDGINGINLPLGQVGQINAIRKPLNVTKVTVEYRTPNPISFSKSGPNIGIRTPNTYLFGTFYSGQYNITVTSVPTTGTLYSNIYRFVLNSQTTYPENGFTYINNLSNSQLYSPYINGGITLYPGFSYSLTFE